MTDELEYKLTNELRFVPRLDGDRVIRVLQQKWLWVGEWGDGFEWRDVPFDVDGE